MAEIRPIFVTSLQAFHSLLSKCHTANHLLVVDFYADWCNPCRVIAPAFEALCSQYSSKGIVFAKVNADQCRQLCQEEFVTSLPTFKLYRKNECVATVVGGNLRRLTQLLNKYSIPPPILQLATASDKQLQEGACKNLMEIIERLLSSSQHVMPIDTSSQTTTNFTHVPGFKDCLLRIGFQEEPTCLRPPTQSVDKEELQLLLDQLRSLILKEQSSPSSGAVSTPRDQALGSETSSRILGQGSRESFFTRLESYKQTLAGILDQEAQAMANSIVPSDRLLREAALRSDCNLDAINSRQFLRQLLRWFKEEFFRWADDFKCETCGTKLIYTGSSTPTPEEHLLRADNVELYACPVDSAHPRYRFPRINDPRALLQSRLGRCGEWALCFALCLFSVRHPIHGKPIFPGCRVVVDWTDHVWCEVWLEDNTRPGHFRWFHCDTSGEVDQPLLYECGWGKKLNYVFAYTLPPAVLPWQTANGMRAIDVQDVIWRYTHKFPEVITRRNQVSEVELASYLTRVHKEAASEWANAEASLVSLQLNHPFKLSCIATELASFLVQPKPPQQRLPGRQTGSLQWRLARGELGADDPALQTWKGNHITLQPTESELQQGWFYLRYSSTLDAYQRPYSDQTPDRTANMEQLKRQASDAGLNGWMSAATRWKNIERKVERDWHMVYLAREEDSPSDIEGVVEWDFELKNEHYSIGQVSLFANIACHAPEAAAHLSLCSDDEDKNVCVRLEPGAPPLFGLTEFQGARHLRLQGRLWTRDCDTVVDEKLAWQKSQLFRQKDNDYNTWSLEWKIQLVPKPNYAP